MNGSSGFDPSRLKASANDYSSSASESEDEYLRPGLDAAGGDDFADLNPRKKRKVGGNNKEKAALGIFGSDSEDDGPARAWKRKTLRSKGMSFVSTSEPRNAGGEDQDEQKEEDSEDARPVMGFGQRANDTEDEDEDEEMGNTGVGLGFGRASTAFGLARNGNSKSDDEQESPEPPSRPSFQSRASGGSMLGGGFVPSSEQIPVLSASAKAAPPPPKNKPQQSAFTSKGKVNQNSFGARMMAKMGYVEGKGLGKEGQGRSVVIEANLRPQGAGLGAVKEKSAQERQEEKRQAELRGEKVEDSEEEEKKRRRRAKKKTIGSAFDSAGSTPRRQKTKYLTAEELRAQAPGLHIPEAFAPILDMTGPEGKMLTSTSGIMTPSSGVPESSDVIEVKKLVRRAQADLLAFSEEWRSLEERKTWINLELEERQQEVDDLRSDFDKLYVFAQIVSDELVSASEWDQVISALKRALDLGASGEEVSDLAVAAIHPHLRDPEWDPLKDPGRFVADLKPLAGLLMKHGNEYRAVGTRDSSTVQHDDVYRQHHKATTPYETMMYKTWLPQVLAAVRTWDPMDPGPMVDLVERWDSLLPPFVRAQLMDNIARRLEGVLQDWNPKKKRSTHHLPHSWLFPWLQHLPSYHLNPKGTGLVSDVKRKFRTLISSWSFERGLIPGLSQFKSILQNVDDPSQDQWRPLIMSHVLPAMSSYLRSNFRVDPADQEPYLPILLGVMKWEALLGRAIVAEVLAGAVFPMWEQKLGEWLALEEADFAEVAEWYAWWRGTLLSDYEAEKSVRAEFDKGLRIMNLI